MSQKEDVLRYHIPALGNLEYRLFPYVEDVWDYLAEYVDRLKSIDQLGVVRRGLPGAHHTRYEYVITQLSLIYHMCVRKGHNDRGKGLQGAVKTWNGHRIDSWHKKYPSKGEIAMILAILSNIGHVSETFATERGLLSHLKVNQLGRKAFLRGLPSEFHESFKRDLKEENYYRLSYYIAAFHISRIRLSGSNKTAELCLQLLCSLVDREYEQDEQARSVLRVYRSVRRLAILSLDAIFTPVPVSINLAQLLSSLSTSTGSAALADTSRLQIALLRLQELMRDAVYMSPENMLRLSHHATRVSRCLDEYSESSVHGFRCLFDPDQHYSLPVYSDHVPVLEMVSVSFDVAKYDPIHRTSLIDWESKGRALVGDGFGIWAAAYDTSRDHVKAVFGLLEPLENENRRTKLILACLHLMELVQSSGAEKEESVVAIVEWLLSSLVFPGYMVKIELETVQGYSSIVMQNSLNDVRCYLTEYWRAQLKEENLSKELLHEIECSLGVGEDLRWRSGLTVGLTSSLKVLRGDGERVAEYDGLFLRIGKSLSSTRVCLVEAKSGRNRKGNAVRELRRKSQRIGMQEGRVVALKKYGAYTEYSLAH